MKKELIHDALNFLDDEIIEAVDVLRTKKKRKTNWKLWGSLAACACIFASMAFFSKLMPYLDSADMGDFIADGAKLEESGGAQWENATGASDEESTAQESGSSENTGGGLESESEALVSGKSEGVTIAPTQVDLREVPGESADMVALFIYQGRVYVQNEWIYGHPELVGEYLGTATGKIDEWTQEDGYVELAGSISGDFYSVNGYDPTFMLCMKEADGTVTTFINDNGITLVQGSDLYEDRLQLEGNYHTVFWQDRYAYWNSEEPVQVQEEDMEVIEEVVKQVNHATFQYAERVSPYADDMNLHYLIFQMENGMIVKLKICKDGYVFYGSMDKVYVQIEAELYERLMNIFTP